VHGRRLSPTILTATFRRYTDAAGVAKRKRITPHTYADPIVMPSPERSRC
jgi:hypothetical protein